MKVLLTGAAGFVGHHVLEHLLQNTGWEIVATDSFRHKGVTDRLAEVRDANPHEWHRVTVITHDLSVPFSPQAAARIGEVDRILAVASQSHVDRSIRDPVPFVTNNVAVILNTLEFARTNLSRGPRAKVLLVSSDEVYGPVEHVDGAHAEWDAILPSSPYSASKAAQEAISIAYWRSYGVPVIITNLMNVIGERQLTEKYLPMLIRRISRGETVTIHGSPGNIGTRHYLHARNAADAWLFLLREGPGVAPFPEAHRPPRYNIAGPDVVSNLDLARMVAEITGKPLHYELVDFHSARPGHDPHYGLDPARLSALGWNPPVDFATSLKKTVLWTLEHPHWLAGDQ